MESVGFIGLGQMGGNMAARFLAEGHTVYGTARHRERAQWLVDQGLHWVATPRALAQAADVVFSSVPDDGALRSVALGPDGIIAGLNEAKIWADFSTVSPDGCRDLAELVRERGAVMLDAPVSGSVPQVEAGTLTIMVGGEAAAYTRVEPLLRVLGAPTYVGVNGQGLVLKLAVNMSLAMQMLAFSEGLLLAKRGGVDPKLASEVMTSSAIGSPMLKARAPLVLDLPEHAWFNVALMHKDIELALATADDEGVPTPATAVAGAMLAHASEHGYARSDIAALFTVLEQMTTDRRAVAHVGRSEPKSMVLSQAARGEQRRTAEAQHLPSLLTAEP
jgi:3-hydroxyisobutyrate dehydrogenase-like beta-hydroxyacid dehydrogenase